MNSDRPRRYVRIFANLNGSEPIQRIPPLLNSGFTFSQIGYGPSIECIQGIPLLLSLVFNSRFSLSQIGYGPRLKNTVYLIIYTRWILTFSSLSLAATQGKRLLSAMLFNPYLGEMNLCLSQWHLWKVKETVLDRNMNLDHRFHFSRNF